MTDSTSSFPSPSSWWNHLVVSLPILTLIGFFCFLMFLGSIFGEWGLSPLQLISPTDTIVPGVLLGMFFALIIYLPFALALPIGWARGERRWHPLTIGLWVVTAIGGFLWFIDPLGVSLRLFAVYFAAAASLRLLFDDRTTTHRPLWKTIAFCAVALPMSFWVVTATGTLFNQVTKVGLARDMVVAQKDGAPCDGDILWLGERAIVIRCATSADIRVMTPKDGLPMTLKR